MKSRDEISGQSDGAQSDRSSEVSTSVPDILKPEMLCKDIYLSLGVEQKDIPASSDDDVANILEEMNRLKPCGQSSGERNIEDILREAELLLDSSTIKSDACGDSSLSLSRSSTDIYSRSSHSRHSRSQRDAKQRHVASVVHSRRENYESIHPDDDDIEINDKCLGTPLEVTYQRIHDQIRNEVEDSLIPHITGDFPDIRLSLPIPGLDTPATEMPGCFSLEQEFLEERKRCLKLKADLDWLRKQHEREVADLRDRHEGQLLQVQEELKCASNKKIVALEKEVETQEKIISSYQTENEKMCKDLKTIKRALLKLMALLKADNGSDYIPP